MMKRNEKRGFQRVADSPSGDNSIEEVIEYNLPDDELKKFKACCATIRQNIANAEAFWKK